MGKMRPRLSPAGWAGDVGDWRIKRIYLTPKSNNKHTSTEVEYTYTFRVWKEPLHFHNVGHYQRRRKDFLIEGGGGGHSLKLHIE